jgi:hypothetical protein
LTLDQEEDKETEMKGGLRNAPSNEASQAKAQNEITGKMKLTGI